MFFTDKKSSFSYYKFVIASYQETFGHRAFLGRSFWAEFFWADVFKRKFFSRSFRTDFSKLMFKGAVFELEPLSLLLWAGVLELEYLSTKSKISYLSSLR